MLQVSHAEWPSSLQHLTSKSSNVYTWSAHKSLTHFISAFSVEIFLLDQNFIHVLIVISENLFYKYLYQSEYFNDNSKKDIWLKSMLASLHFETI